MQNDAVTVVYKWTAHPGKLDILKSIYQGVTQSMEQNEPGALAVEVHVSEDDNAIYVRDDFKDANAVAFHLQETASAHFGDLMSIATPGLFQFFGQMPEALKGAIRDMGLSAEFATPVSGFQR